MTDGSSCGIMEPAPRAGRGRTMRSIELTDEESSLLCEVLESYRSELRTEISHTDNRELRDALKRKARALEALTERFEAVPR